MTLKAAEMQHLPVSTGDTIETARRTVAQTLRSAGFETPDLDARLLVGHALGFDHAALASGSRRKLAAEEAGAIAALSARRLAHEPVARILGEKEFWGLPLQLSPATLIPRPETETVVEAALDALGPARGENRELRLADLGTGSGALMLALLRELPRALGIGTDVNVPALAVAHRNAARLQLCNRAAFVACDFGAALSGPFDLVVSNPPYIATGDIEGLDPEVRDHDPRIALDGGADGLACYRTIAADARRLLKPDGVLVVELGLSQESAVAAIMTERGVMPDHPARHDLAGIPRALVSRPLP